MNGAMSTMAAIGANEEFPLCQICCEEYEEGPHVPRPTCAHLICPQCAEDLILRDPEDTQLHYPCPFCNDPKQRNDTYIRPEADVSPSARIDPQYPSYPMFLQMIPESGDPDYNDRDTDESHDGTLVGDDHPSSEHVDFLLDPTHKKRDYLRNGSHHDDVYVNQISDLPYAMNSPVDHSTPSDSFSDDENLTPRSSHRRWHARSSTNDYPADTQTSVHEARTETPRYSVPTPTYTYRYALTKSHILPVRTVVLQRVDDDMDVKLKYRQTKNGLLSHSDSQLYDQSFRHSQMDKQNALANGNSEYLKKYDLNTPVSQLCSSTQDERRLLSQKYGSNKPDSDYFMSKLSSIEISSKHRSAPQSPSHLTRYPQTVRQSTQDENTTATLSSTPESTQLKCRLYKSHSVPERSRTIHDIMNDYSAMRDRASLSSPIDPGAAWAQDKTCFSINADTARTASPPRSMETVYKPCINHT